MKIRDTSKKHLTPAIAGQQLGHTTAKNHRLITAGHLQTGAVPKVARSLRKRARRRLISPNNRWWPEVAQAGIDGPFKLIH
jgi:hypothetical protein